MSEAIGKLIRGEEKVWDGYLEVLRKYLVWERDYTQLTGLYSDPKGKQVRWNGEFIRV